MSRHRIDMATTDDAGMLVGRATCACGWMGEPYDIGEPEERRKYDNEVRVHRLTVGLVRVSGCLMLSIVVSWVAVIVAGTVWLLRAAMGL
jgi:hypothetical protein